MAQESDFEKWDVGVVDTFGMEEKPTLPDMRFEGVGSALEFDAVVQRCEGGKDDKTCNTLNKVKRECLLKVEPMPQFPFVYDAGKRGLHKQIIDHFYNGDTTCTNPGKEKVPDGLYRDWGDRFYSAWPARKDASVRNTTCGMHCFTQIVRYLKKKGESRTVYEIMMDDLKASDPDTKARLRLSAPVMMPGAKGEDPALKDEFDAAATEKRKPLWDPDSAAYYKSWYPMWVLWWIRANEGTTWDQWTKKKEYLVNSRGIFLWQQFTEFAKTRAKKNPDQADAAKLCVPESLQKLGLKMEEGRRKGKVMQNIKTIVKALDDGYPVVLLRPGHFVLVSGYTEDDKGLRFIINDSGWNPIQYFIDPYVPHTIDTPDKNKDKVSALGKTVTTAEDGTESTEGDGEETAKRELQKQGYHVTTLVKEEDPKTETTKTKTGTITKVRTKYQFNWDWRIRSFWWDQWFVLKFAEGEVDKQTFAVKAGEATDPEPPPAETKVTELVVTVKNKSGTPVKGADVDIILEDKFELHTAKTDGSGKATFKELLAGSYGVGAAEGDRSVGGTVDVSAHEPGNPNKLDLTLSPVIYFAFYYHNTHKGQPWEQESFKKAADTWVSKTKTAKSLNDDKAHFIVQPITTGANLIQQWQAVLNEAKTNGVNVQEGRLFMHASTHYTAMFWDSWSGTEHGLELLDSDQANAKADTFTQSRIKALPKLPWASDGRLVLHGCHTGSDAGGWIPAQVFATSQGVKAVGCKGWGYFSELENKYQEISATSTDVFLWDYVHGKNVGGFFDGKGSGERVDGAEFSP